MYEDYLTKALVGIINAKQALKNYKSTKIKDLKNTAAYNLQQSIEYMLKYKIYNCPQYNLGQNSVKQIFSHDLDMLIKSYCLPFGIFIPQDIITRAKTYSTWEAESRYRLGFSVRIDVLETAIKNAESWLIQIKPYYRKKLAQVNQRLQI